MTVDGGVPFGIWTGGNVRGVTIASLTIRDVYSHPIILNAGTQSPLIHNVRLVNAGQQFIKANPDGAGGGVDNGIVEYSVIEYTTTSRDYYTNGVDVHTGDNWIVRHNLFRNLRAPQGQLAGPAILMWNASTGSIVDGNTFIDCQREIALGLIERTPNDHTGGIVRNNFIYRAQTVAGDSAVYVADSPGTQVLHNSILVSGTYQNPIEYRFAHTTGTVIANNVLDGRIAARDGATGTVSGNLHEWLGRAVREPAGGRSALETRRTGAHRQSGHAARQRRAGLGRASPAGRCHRHRGRRVRRIHADVATTAAELPYPDLVLNDPPPGGRRSVIRGFPEVCSPIHLPPIDKTRCPNIYGRSIELRRCAQMRS